MEKINILIELLRKAETTHRKEYQKYLEQKKRGKCFNVFDVLNLSRNEIRLHSAFIAELLNPSGSHGLGDKFLVAFVETIFDKDQKISEKNFAKEFNTESAKVKVEHNIGLINEKRDRGGRIDIFIKDSGNNAIIIENKIDACDQPNQLIRYKNYADTQTTNYKLLYLTKEGGSASEESAGKDTEYYIPISYRHDILSWLQKCIGISAAIPTVRETISQYIINLKEILNIMENTYKDKIVEIATKKEYVDATVDILNHSWDIQTQLRRRFIQELEDEANNFGLIVDDEEGKELESIANLAPRSSYIYFTPKRFKDSKWSFCVGWDNYADGLYYGISTHRCNFEKKIICDQVYDLEPNCCWPLGLSVLKKLNEFTSWEDLESRKKKLTSEFKKIEGYIEVVEEAEKKFNPG